MKVAEPPIEYITQRIVEALQPRRIVLFGSRARGDAGPQSDVDIMVEMESDLRAPRRAMEIDKLFRGRRWAMDVFVYTPDEVRERRHVVGTLVHEIETEGKVLYERR